MPDEIVQKELAHDTSNATIARLANQRTKFRGIAKKLTSERDAGKVRITELEGQLLEAKKHEGAAKELSDLRTQVKLDKHRSKFDELAKAAGAKPKGLDDLWEKSGYDSKGDVPDEKAMTKAIEAQREARDYLFDADGEAEPAAGGPDTPPEPEVETPKPGPARGQGGTKRSTGSQTQITDSQMRDPLWCFANAGKLATAAAAAADLPTGQVGSKLAIL
jgi:hypothetical protein